jgi:hypothetical protein
MAKSIEEFYRDIKYQTFYSILDSESLQFSPSLMIIGNIKCLVILQTSDIAELYFICEINDVQFTVEMKYLFAEKPVKKAGCNIVGGIHKTYCRFSIEHLKTHENEKIIVRFFIDNYSEPEGDTIFTFFHKKTVDCINNYFIIKFIRDIESKQIDIFI